MLRTRHFALLWLLGLAACAARQEQEPASPAGAGAATPQQQPGYGMAPPPPANQPAKSETAPSSAATPATGDDAKLPPRDEDQYASLAEAEAALEQAKAELGGPAARARPTDEEPGKKPPPKKPSRAGGSAPSELAQGTDRCLNACKAFASLRRAASAVCRLAGESNARCKRAQGIVQENEVRVAVCKCSQNGD